jgi:hypothetical protein
MLTLENYVSLATHLLISIPPTNTMSDIVLIKYGDLIKNQAPYLKWVGYLSSTGVHGNHEGNWVNEESDDEPTPTHVADKYACKLLNRDPLPLIAFSEAHLSLMEQEFYPNNRRVSNLKIKEELKVTLNYPTYKEGLTKLWRTDFAAK